jgi:putative flavoprotein involved in K+ transport
MKNSRKPSSSRTITTVIIGAGQAGLAMSRCLTEHSIDHVLLERGEVANSWRKERWDSLRLLTPNWQTKLPGYQYEGNNPDGFMTMPDVINFMDSYAEVISAPVQTGVTVTGVYPLDNDLPNNRGYRVVTNQGEWQCRTLVIASGAFNTPVIPKVSTALPASIDSLSSQQYRNPEQLKEGGVLVVGGSATGLQLADEIQRSGRSVSLSTGEHVRMPRQYRGRDIFWWMEQSGLSNQYFDQADDIKRARRVPSPQLVGSTEHIDLDLNYLTKGGVKVLGRLSGMHNQQAQFSGSLANVCKLADLKMKRLLNTFDEWALKQGMTDSFNANDFQFEPTRIDHSPTLNMDLSSGEIKTVIWATGFKPDYQWLNVPVTDHKGHLRHTGGVVDAPGMYVMGLPFMRRRKSSFIHGANDDAIELSNHLVKYLAKPASHSHSQSQSQNNSHPNSLVPKPVQRNHFSLENSLASP